MEERIARIESTLVQTAKTLDRIEREIVGIQAGMLEMRDRAIKLRDRIDSLFAWAIGAMITMWVTIILAILFKG